MTSVQLSPAAIRRGIEYTRAGGVGLQMDAFTPPRPGPHAAVIVVHGGGWVRGDRATSVEPILDALTRAGVAWFSISYRFASDLLLIGTAVDDVQAALDYVRRHAVEFDIDPNRIALAGESAGAPLASMAALREGREKVRGVVALYSPSDLVSLAKTSPLVPASIRDAVQQSGWSGLVLGLLRNLSPVEHVSSSMPPFFLIHGLIHGAADPIVPARQSEDFCKKAQAAGADCELLLLSGAGHGIRGWEGAGSLQVYKAKMIAWLRERLA